MNRFFKINNVVKNIYFNMKTEDEERLEEIKVENFIWIIYIGIIILSWYSNSLEKRYVLFKNSSDKNSYRGIIVFIFLVLVIVYFYFLRSSYSDVCNLKPNDTEKKKILTYASFLASLLIFASGIIFLIIALVDDDLDVELAFN